MRKYITIIALLFVPLFLNAQYVGGLSGLGLKGYVEQTDFDTVHVATSGLWINDVQVTATAAEMNYLDIATLGTGAASKAIVLDTGEDYTWPGTGVLTYGVLNDGSNAITSTALEINYCDITTLGTQEASKVVTTDANVNSGVSKVTELHIGATGAEVQVNATPAELNLVADMSERVVDCTASTLSATLALHGDRIITLNRAAGITVTLPLATGTGASYTFIIGTTVSSNSTVIQVGDGTDVMDGGLAFGVDTDIEGATGYTWSAAAGDDTVTMDGTATGGVVGDYIKCIDYATDSWYIEVHLQQSGGAEATPFSSAV